jgi:hypothetical protein
LLLNHRKNTTIYAVPEVRTGDADFDQVFLLNGFPAEVLQQALDASIRGWLLERFRDVTPTLETENGRLTVSVSLRATKGMFSLSYGRQVLVYAVPGSSDNRLLWPTAPGNLMGNGFVPSRCTRSTAAPHSGALPIGMTWEFCVRTSPDCGRLHHWNRPRCLKSSPNRKMLAECDSLWRNQSCGSL